MDLYTGPVADVIDLFRMGFTDYFFYLWKELLYTGGSWIVSPYLNVLAVIDPDTLQILYGEYHPTLAETGYPGNATAPMPSIFTGSTPESIDFLQEQIQAYATSDQTGILGDLVNCDTTFMVSINPIKRQKTDEYIAGYILWAVELSAKIDVFSQSKKSKYFNV